MRILWGTTSRGQSVIWPHLPSRPVAAAGDDWHLLRHACCDAGAGAGHGTGLGVTWEVVLTTVWDLPGGTTVWELPEVATVWELPGVAKGLCEKRLCMYLCISRS